MGARIEQAEPPLGNAEAVFLTIYRAAVAAAVSGFTREQLRHLVPGLQAFAEEGEKVTISDYFAALKGREALTAGLKNYDALVLPTVPILAFEAGELVLKSGQFAAWWQWTPFSAPFNLAKAPAASIP